MSSGSAKSEQIDSGSEEEEEEEEEEELEGEEEEEEEEEEVLPPRELPQRATRAQRLGQLLEDDDSADEEFWNQDFFAEEDKDAEFEASESEQEDVPDSDFSESEDEDDEDEDANEARLRAEERGRRKTLKPPGAAAARRPQPAPKKDAAEAAGPSSPTSPGTRAAIKVAQIADAAEQVQAPQLRKSTRQRVEDAEKERVRIEQVKPRKKRGGVDHRHLTQEELLAEAAKTEIENLRSLEALQAAEEEVRKRAAVKKARYSGPTVRFHSKRVNGEALTTYEIANMLPPPHMHPQYAPPPVEPARCAVTGELARYRDPLTGLPYRDVEAFRELAKVLASDGMRARDHRSQRHGGE